MPSSIGTPFKRRCEERIAVLVLLPALNEQRRIARRDVLRNHDSTEAINFRCYEILNGWRLLLLQASVLPFLFGDMGAHLAKRVVKPRLLIAFDVFFRYSALECIPFSASRDGFANVSLGDFPKRLILKHVRLGTEVLPQL